MSPSTITLSNRGFPGSAGRTGKISCAWRMRCLLHTFIIWFWNRISMSTKSCLILLHHSWSCHIYSSPDFICLLTFGSSFNSIYHVKNLFFPVDEMYMARFKNRLDTDVYHWAKLKAEATCCKTVTLNLWIYLRKRVSEMYFNVHHTLQTTYANWIYFSSSHWILKQTTVDSPCFAISEIFFL